MSRLNRQNRLPQTIDWSQPLTAAAAAIGASILWGSGFPTLKLLYAAVAVAPGNYAAQMYLAGVRFFTAGLILLLFAHVRLRIGTAVKLRQFLLAAVLGFFQTALHYFLFYSGVARTSGIKSSILHSGSTFMMVLAAHFVYKNDKLDRTKAIGLLTGFAGIVIANGQQAAAGIEWSFALRGEGFILLAGLSTTTAVLLGKRLTASIHPVVLTAWQLLFGSGLLLAVGGYFGGSHGWTWNAAAVGLTLYSAVLSAAAFSIWYTLLKFHPAGGLALYRFMIPVSGAVLSSLVLPGEVLSIFSVLALACVSTGIWVVFHRRHGRKNEKEAA